MQTKWGKVKQCTDWHLITDKTVLSMLTWKLNSARLGLLYNPIQKCLLKSVIALNRTYAWESM